MTDDQHIIELVLGGDIDAFEVLVERYRRPVVFMVRNIVNDRHLSEDIGQEVFFTAYRKLSSFDPGRSSFSTWLFTIARNRSISALKKKKVSSMGELPEAAGGEGPSDNLDRGELFGILDAALDRLPGRQRRAFVMVELEKKSYQQVAQIEAARLGTIKSRVNRARKKIMAVLKKYMEE